MRERHSTSRISRSVAAVVVVALAACSGGGGGGGDDGPTPDRDPPRVIATSPGADASNVPLSLAVVTATFSEGMDASTLTDATFAVSGATGAVSYDAVTRTASFVPDGPLESATTYTATITTGVMDAAGNPLAADEIWSFETVNTHGSPDPEFGTSGVAVTPFGASFEEPSAVAVQGDGKIVVVGNVWTGSTTDVGIARYHPDGTLDEGFGAGGKVVTSVAAHSDRASDVAIQGDGKIVVAGSAYDGSGWTILVLRYAADGSLDPTFDGDGIVTTSFIPGVTSEGAGSVVIQPADGKIVVGGSTTWTGSSDYDFALARYTSAGALDPTFGSGGTVTTAISVGTYTDSISALALQADGKIVAAGTGRNGTITVARYTAGGALDGTFSGDGKHQSWVGDSDQASDVLVQPDGKIVVAGTTYTERRDFVLLRYTSGGALDVTFGGTGIVLASPGPGENYGFALARQADGKLVTVGQTWVSGTRFALSRHFEDGSPDPTFGDGGTVVSIAGLASDVKILPDGAILAVGRGYFEPYTSSHFAAVRYLP
jgi:uncharacterized delta-60 repeat protein